MKKTILFWSRTPVQKKSGTSVVIKNLFDKVDYEYFFVNENYSEIKKIKNQILFNLPKSNDKVFGRIFNVFRFLLIPAFLIYGIFITFKIKPNKIITVYNDFFWILTSYFISKIFNKKLILYVHDLAYPKYKYWNKLQYISYLIFEPIIFKDKNVNVITVTDQQAHIINRKYNCRASALPFFFEYKKKIIFKKYNLKPSFIIGFSGTIHDENLIQIKSLSKLIKKSENVEMRIFSNNYLNFRDVINPNNNKKIKFFFINQYSLLISKLNECDLLYHPLFFKNDKKKFSTYKDTQISKSLDYLYSSTPVLLHSPKSTFTFKTFKRYNSCYFVTNSSNLVLFDKILKIKKKREYKFNFEYKKKRTIEYYFNKNKILNKFKNLINQI